MRREPKVPQNAGNKETVQAIKSTVDMVALAQAKGIRMKKNGKSWFGLCPFHNDKTPSLSINPENNLFKCFGCGTGGDVIRFVELFDQVDFKEAVRRLSPISSELIGSHAVTACRPPESPSKSLPENPPENPSENPLDNPNVQQYLERVAAIYEDNFAQKDKARKYLNDRHITDAGLFTKHAIGFCDNTLNDILPQNGNIRDTLKQLGILLKNGSERFNNCLVFPVHDMDGNIITLYGRNTDPASKRKHLFLPDRSTGIWNSNIIKTCSEIIITESIMDALSVHMAGFTNAVSIQGTNGLTEQAITDFITYQVQKIILLLDGDAPGIKAAKRLKEKLTGITLVIKILPDSHDPNSYLIENGPQKLAEFIQADDQEQTQHHPEPMSAPQHDTETPSGQNGFIIPCGIRNYRIMGLDKGPHKLKATIRLEHAGKLHVDTLDLYSARSRRTLAQDLCRVFEELPETIESDITRIIRECENMKDDPSTEQKHQTPTMTDKEKKEAERFGRSKKLIKMILDDFVTCGLIGEDANKLLGYIAMTSRKRKKPIAMQILSSSGSGKTTLQDAIVSFCPPEDLVKLTSLSGKALFYKEQNSLKHKVLALEEGDGAESASYAIRSLISSGVLINETTIKDLSTGRLTTMENRVEGPTAVFYTTTNPDIDPETKSRFFVTGIDESREQTRKILAFQRENHSRDDMTESIKTEAVIKKHHNFQRLLKPLGVKNPYSQQLTYADDRLQGRRDQPKYLNLIKSTAFLRQMQKQIKYDQKNGKAVPFIEADHDDLHIANKLAWEILGRSLDELSRPGRDLLMLLDEMVEKLWKGINGKSINGKSIGNTNDTQSKRTDITFIRRDIREYTGWSNYRVHTHLRELVHLEYILVESGKNGSFYRYRLAYEGQGKDGSKFILGLTNPEELKN